MTHTGLSAEAVWAAIARLDYHKILDYCGNVGFYPDDDAAKYVAHCLQFDLRESLAQLIAHAAEDGGT